MYRYAYLSWDDSKFLHPGNKANDFLIDFPNTIDLRGEWFVALSDVKIKAQTKKSIFVLSDVCEESYVKGNKYPVLRRLDDKSSDFDNPRFVKVIAQQIQRIRIWLLTDNWKAVNIADFKCTLCFKSTLPLIECPWDITP